MPLWLKIVADITRQAKLIKAGPVAGWLWLGGLGYCRTAENDGFIPKAIVPTLVPGIKSAFKHASVLVEVGLWDDAIGGYQVHDYLAWNPSKDQLEAKRDADRERKRGLDSKRNPNGIQVEPHAYTRAGANSPSTQLDSGFGSEDGSEESSTGVAPVFGFGRKGAGGRFDALVTTHPRCDPATFAACNRGICVPHILAAEWRQQMDPDRCLPDVATNEIKAAVRDGLALLEPTGPVPDDGFTFWRGVWKTRHSRTSARAAANVNAPSGPDWFDDCKALHANECSSKAAHESRVFSENFRAEQAEAAKGRAS